MSLNFERPQLFEEIFGFPLSIPMMYQRKPELPAKISHGVCVVHVYLYGCVCSNPFGIFQIFPSICHPSSFITLIGLWILSFFSFSENGNLLHFCVTVTNSTNQL